MGARESLSLQEGGDQVQLKLNITALHMDREGLEGWERDKWRLGNDAGKLN